MYHHREQKEPDWARWKEMSSTEQKYKLMRLLLANTEKCCFPKVGEDTEGIAYVPSGLKTLG